MDRQLNAARALPALFYRRDLRLSGCRLLAGASRLEACLCRWRKLRAALAEPPPQDRLGHGDGASHCRDRLRLPRAASSQLMNGKHIMTRLMLAVAALLISSSVFAAERTVTLAVQNMFCADCPFVIRKSLEAVPGVAKAVVSLKDQTAVVTYDDAKVDVKSLTDATTNAGYPSAPKI